MTNLWYYFEIEPILIFVFDKTVFISDLTILAKADFNFAETTGIINLIFNSSLFNNHWYILVNQ